MISLIFLFIVGVLLWVVLWGMFDILFNRIFIECDIVDNYAAQFLIYIVIALIGFLILGYLLDRLDREDNKKNNNKIVIKIVIMMRINKN